MQNTILTAKQTDIAKEMTKRWAYIEKFDALHHFKDVYGNLYSMADILRAYNSVDAYDC